MIYRIGRSFTKAPVPLCAQGVIGAAALATQAQVDVCIDDRVYPTSCFLLSVGESGERKSAIDTVVNQAIREHERELQKLYNSDCATYSNDLEAWQYSRKEALKAKDLNARQQALKELGSAPSPPLNPVSIVEEPSYEGLVMALENGQPCMGLFSDEGGRFMGRYAMSKDNQLKTVSGLSSLWDRKPISRSRTEGTKILHGRRLSLHLMMQGVVMQSIMGSSIMTGQGIMSRCLVVSPESTAGTRFYTEASVTNDPRVKNFQSTISQILKKPHPLEAGMINSLLPPAMALNTTAKALWIQ